MISLEDVQKLADLSRLSVTDEEKKNLQKDIEGILDYVGQIKNIKVEENKGDVKQINIMRSDSATNLPGAFTEKLVKAAPMNQDGYIKVKKIL
jgi:aspartyl-tRNA(Asn)/glutamyl-tRNA(Gln) amidotransferase subunit C